MFAVIKTGGRQYRVVPDDVLEIGKIAGDVGTIVQLGEVLVVGGDTPVLGMPTVAGASVAAEVLDHKRGPKVIAFKKRRRKNSRRKRGSISARPDTSAAIAARSRCFASPRS